MLKKSISVILVLVMIISVFTIRPFSAYEADGDDTAAALTNDDLSVTGDNSLGAMLADEYASADIDDDEEAFSRIYAVEIEGKAARAELDTFTDARLIVSVFDEEGKMMYGSGMTDVTPEDSIVELTLDIDTMPQYFLVRAFLLDQVTNLPLCKQYEDDYYTQKMQEFLAKTTEDFDEDKVLNLDDSTDNNFLVYKDDTIIIKNDDNSVNVVTKADNEAKEYVIENIDESISSLQAGDVFSYENEDNSIIVKIASITINGMTATIQGEDIELKDVFDYIRIDASQGISEGNVDNSGIDEDLEFAGYEEDDELAPTGVQDSEVAESGFELIDEDKVAEGVTLRYNFVDNKIEHGDLKAKVTGSISVKIDVALTCYYEKELFEKDEVLFRFNAKIALGVDLGFEFSATKKWEIGKTFYPIIPGALHATLTANFVVKGKITGNISGKYTGQIGYKYKNGKWESDDKKAHFEAEVKFEASVFIGLSIEPAIEVTALGAVSVIEGGGELESGVTIKAKLDKKLDLSQKTERHECKVCIEGELSFSVTCSATLKFLESERLQLKASITPYEAKIADCYYSVDYEEFGWGKCPHKEYLSKFCVMKQVPDTKALTILPGASVSISVLTEHKDEATGRSTYTPSGKNYTETTDSKGYAELFLPNCRQDVTVTCEKMKPSLRRISVTKADTYIFTLTPEEEPTEPPTEAPTAAPTQASTQAPTQASTQASTETQPTEEPTVPAYIINGKCGDNVYWHLTEDGILYITGTGSMYNYTVSTKRDYYYTYYNTDAPWNSYKAAIKAVIIKEGVTSIGNSAFGTDSNIESIDIPFSVINIGNNAFYKCTSLMSVTIPNSATSIGENVFLGCTSLTSVILSDSLASIGKYAFNDCTSLTSVRIPDSVTWIGDGAFAGCTSLTNITIPDSVKSIGWGAFSQCTCLTSVTIGNSVTSINYRTFYNCKNLSNASISDSVTSIEKEAFSGCYALMSIYIPKSVTSIGDGAFLGCACVVSVDPDTNTAIAYPSILTIYGYPDSEAERYANRSDNNFISLSGSTVTGLQNMIGATGAMAPEYTRFDLVPGTEAVLIIFAGEDIAGLSAENLLYIVQGTVDENGEVGFDAPSEYDCETWTAKIYGQCNHSSATWSTILEPMNDSVGVKICTCDYCGEIINSLPILQLADPNILGDSDGDGEITVMDATWIQRKLAKLKLTESFDEKAADVDSDGEITIADVTWIQRKLAKLKTPYPVGEWVS